MQGCDLIDGIYSDRKLSNEEMWESFNWLFSKRSKNDSSYKFIFLKAIIDCLDKKDSLGRISFDVLFEDFTKTAWNLVLKYEIAQKGKVRDGRITLLERTLYDNYSSDVLFDNLSDSERDKICRKIKQACKKYVVGALYGDMKGYLYSFSKKEEWVAINPQMEIFIKENRGIIENLNYYKWAKFYQEINDIEKEAKLMCLVDSSFMRKNESVYRSVLAYEFEHPEKESRPVRVNTIELLFEAEKIEEKVVEDVDAYDIEDELYRDMSHLKTYLADPILLINRLKREKGISI